MTRCAAADKLRDSHGCEGQETSGLHPVSTNHNQGYVTKHTRKVKISPPHDVLKTNGPISFGFTGNPRSAESKALGKKREARYTMAPYGLWCVYIYIYILLWRFPKMGYPYIIHVQGIFHYKPSI